MADFERILRRAEPKTLIDYADLERPMLGPGMAERVAEKFTQSVRETAETYLESRRDNMKFQVQMAESSRADRKLEIEEEKFQFEKDKIDDAFIRESMKKIANFDAIGKKTFDEFSGQLSSDTEKNFLKAEWERAKIQDTKLSSIHNGLRDKNIKDYTPDDIRKLKQYSEYKTTKFFNVIKNPDLTGKYKRVTENPNYYNLISIGETEFKKVYPWMDWEEFKATDPANWRTAVKEQLDDTVAAVAPITPKEKKDFIIKTAAVAADVHSANVISAGNTNYGPTAQKVFRGKAKQSGKIVGDLLDNIVPGLGVVVATDIDPDVLAATKRLEQLKKETAELEKQKSLFKTTQDEVIDEDSLSVRQKIAIDSLPSKAFGTKLNLRQGLDKLTGQKITGLKVPSVLTLQQIGEIFNSGELDEEQSKAVLDYFKKIEASGTKKINATDEEYLNLIKIIYKDF